MNLQAQWVVGFVDGEGCFHVGINANKEMSLGYQVLPEFTVVQHVRDINVLYALKKFFGCGVVRNNHGERMAYRVRSVDHHLRIIIPFFEQHTLKTKKHIDFLKFRDVLLMMQKQQHLSTEGFMQIQAKVRQMRVRDI